MDIIIGLSLLGFCFTLTRFARCRIETAPFFVISTVVTILYLLGYANHLRLGTDIIVAIGFLLLLLSPWLLPKDRRALFRDYLPPGFVIPVAFIVLFSFLASHSYVGGVDEFAHWAKAAKWVFLNHGFIQSSNAISQKSYPLGSAIFYYIFFRFQGYSESSAFVAQAILTLAPLVVLFQGFS